MVDEVKEKGGRLCAEDGGTKACLCSTELCNGQGSSDTAALAQAGEEEGEEGNGLKRFLSVASKVGGNGGRRPFETTANYRATYSILIAATATLVAVAQEI